MTRLPLLVPVFALHCGPALPHDGSSTTAGSTTDGPTGPGLTSEADLQTDADLPSEPQVDPLRERLVFVSDGVTDARRMQGLDGADAFCQASADAAGLGGLFDEPRGVFKAWISDRDTDAWDRLYAGEGPYVLPPFWGDAGKEPGAVVAWSWADLLWDGPMHPIDVTEHGDHPNGTGVWTGTAPDGRAAQDVLGLCKSGLWAACGDHCGGWTNMDAFGVVGNADWAESSDDWTRVESVPCFTAAHLYCVEQE